MLDCSKLSDIKKAQKEAHLFRSIAELVRKVTLETPSLTDVYVTRVELSPGKSLCYVYFYTPKGVDYFHSVLDELILYKPSLRKALADTIKSRYTVELAFVFDKQFEKVQRMEELLDKIKQETETCS